MDAQNLFKKSKIKISSTPPTSIWKPRWLDISIKKNCKLVRLKKQEMLRENTIFT